MFLLRHRLAAMMAGLGLWLGACGFNAADSTNALANGDWRGLNPTFRNDGKFVHNVGRLLLQITNFGETGNRQNPAVTTVPCAEWPPGSGDDYLFSAGLWVGAVDANGIPHVTTATYEREFLPDPAPSDACVPGLVDRVADIRETYEGSPGGNRIISASLNPDDDGDGRVDEDFLNGLDDDGDGLCDEDYSAIGQQMFSCEYLDYLARTRQQYPEHVPLGLRIRQTSYAWATPGQSDLVGMDYKIINESGQALRNVYVAIFADMDIGNRAMIDTYYRDDQAALLDTLVDYIGPSGGRTQRRIQMGYMWDNVDNPARPTDIKGGDAPGYFGCMFLNHTTDPAGISAPSRVGITAYKFFFGNAPFPAGGDPANDADRYKLISDPTLRPDAPTRSSPLRSVLPRDYRFIMATGPFRQILPDSALTISLGWVIGLGLRPAGSVGTGGTLVENAIAAQQVFDGIYTDFDGNATTGSCGKEACLRFTQIGGRGFTYSIPDTSVCKVRFHSSIDSERFPDLVPWEPSMSCEQQQDGKFVCLDRLGGTIANGGAHCASEDTVPIVINAPLCTYVDLDCDVDTGQSGREHLVNWVAAAPLPSPFYAGQDGRGEVSDFLRNYATHEDSVRISAWFFPGDKKVTLKWSNFAEQVRDPQKGNLKEFVGYRIYKAAGWKRPLGTNAPSRDLWSLLGEWRPDPRGTPARPLGELLDPSAPIVNINPVTVRWDPAQRQVRNDSSYVEIDTLFALGRYSFVDDHVLNDFPYFYAIVPVSIVPGETAAQDLMLLGNPSASNAQVVYPRGDSQRDQDHVFVVPNPYRGGAEWDLIPRDEDPAGTKVTFHNLPRTRGTIHIYTIAGDLVKDIPFDGRPPADLQFGKNPVTTNSGTAAWNLISRNSQRIVSGIYLYSVDTDLGREVGRFVVIR